MYTDTEVLDNLTPRINLSTSEDIRREMAKVYRETRCNKILPSNGTKLVYMLINILKARGHRNRKKAHRPRISPFRGE